MCGFVGICSLREGIALNDFDNIEAMSNELNHRGPDDGGIYQDDQTVLTHKRLSIIDLSKDANQPMLNEDGTLVIVFNGEIYNFKELADELKKRGHKFRSKSDFEVILHLYEEDKLEFLNKLNGIFAFCLWDKQNAKIILVRDRMGVKPLFYYQNDDVLVFASEIKAILKYKKYNKYPNFDSINQYFLFGHTYDDSTWFNGIKTLLPGHVITYTGNEVSISKYWDLTFNNDKNRNIESFSEELRFLLEDSVKLNLQSDVPISAHLSGGVDSSAIVSIASKQLSYPMETFSSIYRYGKCYDESSKIDFFNKKIRSINNKIVNDVNDIEVNLKNIIWFLEQPVIGPAVLPMFNVCKTIKSKKVKVVLGGQGADELFAGYPPYFSLAVKNLLQKKFILNGKFDLKEFFNVLPYLNKGRFFKNKIRNIFRKSDFSFLFDKIHTDYDTVKNNYFANNEYNEFNFNSYLHIKHYLPGLLQQEDRMSMAWSIESRVPFLDFRIVELASKIPPHMKIFRGYTKYVLRQSLKDIVPKQILFDKNKLGYPVPLKQYLVTNSKEYVINNLINSKISDHIIQKSQLMKMLGNSNSLNRNLNLIWKLLNLELWYQLFFQ